MARVVTIISPSVAAEEDGVKIIFSGEEAKYFSSELKEYFLVKLKRNIFTSENKERFPKCQNDKVMQYH